MVLPRVIWVEQQGQKKDVRSVKGLEDRKWTYVEFSEHFNPVSKG